MISCMLGRMVIKDVAKKNLLVLKDLIDIKIGFIDYVCFGFIASTIVGYLMSNPVFTYIKYDL